jgi:hypothetical protein
MPNRQQILAQRGDLSPFLIHLTRNGMFRTDPTQTARTTLGAKNSLEIILQQSKIRAQSALGYFNYKVAWNGRNQNSQVLRHWLYSCCFTETPLKDISIQFQSIQGRQCHFQPYGLAFFEDTVRARGGNPVLYVETRNQAMRLTFDQMALAPNCIDFKGVMPFVEGFGAPWFGYIPSEIDFRWEREWRCASDFDFQFREVAFGICPTNEIVYFEALTNNQIPFVDVSNPTVLTAAKAKLGLIPRFNGLRL